jgi:hypothetical protein
MPIFPISRLPVDGKVHIPMIPTSWVEATRTLCAFAATLHILLDTQHMLALAAKYCFFVPLTARPDSGFVIFTCIVATNAGVELVAAIMLYGDDVEG